MEDLLPIIQKMLDENFFSPTKSRMAKDLGRKDKNIFYGRLSCVAKDGKAVLGATALEALCRNICYSYNISEYTLSRLVDIWDMACALALDYGEADFLPLVKKRLAIIKDSNLRSKIRQLAKESALDYCYVLAIFFCKALRLDPNQKKNTHALIEVVQNVERILDNCYPENFSAHKVANDTIDQARSIQLFGWCHLMNFVGRVICCYSNPSYLDDTISSGFISLPIDEESWWISTEEQDSENAKLYYLLTNEDQPIYCVLAIDANRSEPIDPDRCSYHRWAFLRDYDVLRSVQPQGNKLLQWGYYDYQYEEYGDSQVICVSPNKELNGKHVPSFMPRALVRVRENSPWGEWITSLEEDIALNILAAKEIESMGLEDTNYEVKDIILSRNTCTLQYLQPNHSIEHVTFSLDNYPSLKSVSVWEDVYILRDPVNHVLYAFWGDSGLLIKFN